MIARRSQNDVNPIALSRELVQRGSMDGRLGFDEQEACIWTMTSNTSSPSAIRCADIDDRTNIAANQPSTESGIIRVHIWSVRTSWYPARPSVAWIDRFTTLAADF